METSSLKICLECGKRTLKKKLNSKVYQCLSCESECIATTNFFEDN